MCVYSMYLVVIVARIFRRHLYFTRWEETEKKKGNRELIIKEENKKTDQVKI